MCSFSAIIFRLNLRHNAYKIQSSQSLYFSTQPQRDIAKQTITKVVNVAIIGAPNSGKSTLINNVVERKICAASNKVHTTTNMTRAIYFQNDTQIVFLDTPGVVSSKEQRKYKLPDSMIGACYKSLRCADVIGVVHDVSNVYTKHKIHIDVLEMLNMVDNIPSFLILNKVDKLKSKKQLLSIIRNVTNGLIAGNPIPRSQKVKEKDNVDDARGYSKFSDVFIVSALEGDGVKDVREYLLNNAKPAGLQYGPSQWTDKPPEHLIVEAVRAKFLDFLAQELPYNLKIKMEYFEDDKEKDRIVCSVIAECPSERIVKLISGAGGGRLGQIKMYVRNDLINLFRKSVVIDILLKAKHGSE